MKPNIKIIGPRELPRAKVAQTAGVVDTCCHDSASWQSGLSPFIAGPCGLYGNYAARRMENAWQYCKVYAEHTDPNFCLDLSTPKATAAPIASYWEWAKEGWDNPRAVRYPMGRGRKPLYSLWDGKALSYIDARKQIYVPLYARCMRLSESFDALKELLKKKRKLVLWDWDGYDHSNLDMSLSDVLNCRGKKMGHAFVLKMMLLYGFDFDFEDLEEYN